MALEKQTEELTPQKISQILSQGELILMSRDLEAAKKEKREKMPRTLGPVKEEKTALKIKEMERAAEKMKTESAQKQKELRKKEEAVKDKEKPEEIEKKKTEEERQKAEERQRIIEAEKKKIEEEKKALARMEEKARLIEEKRLEEEKRLMEEIRKRVLEESRKKEGEEREKLNFIKRLKRQKEKIVPPPQTAAEKTAEPDKKREKEFLEQKLKEIDEKLKIFPEKKAPLEKQKSAILAQKEKLMRELSSLIQKEKEIETVRLSLEEKENRTENPEEKHETEQLRWAEEKKLRQIEEKKWDIEKQTEEFQLKIKNIEEKIGAVSAEENEVIGEKEKLFEKIKLLELRERKQDIEKELNILAGRKNGILSSVEKENKENKETREKLSALLEKEKLVEEAWRVMQIKEREAKTLSEERNIERARWQIEEKRKEIEKTRWFLEKKQKETEQRLKNLNLEIKEIAAAENGLREKLKNIGIILQYGLKEGGRIIKENEEKKEKTRAPEGKTEKEKEAESGREEREEEEKKREEIIRQRLEELKKRAEEQRKSEEDKRRAEKEKLETEEGQKIETIRKMAEEKKEIVEAKGPLSKEKIMEKLSFVSPEEKKRREEFMERVSGKKKPGLAEKPFVPLTPKEKQASGEIIFRPVIKKASLFEKILIRIFIVVIILALGAALYFLLHYFADSQTKPPLSLCGNGKTEENEECDDGNLANGDGCSSLCRIEANEPVCGNGILEASEECDDGNMENEDGCSSLCLYEEIAPPAEPATTTPTSTPLFPPEEPATTTPTSTEANEENGTTSLTELKETIFEGSRIKTFEYESGADILIHLSKTLEENIENNNFTEIVFNKKTVGEKLSLKGFLEFFETKTPEGFWEKINENGIVFLYGNSPNKLGFVAEIKENDVKTIMNDWESAITGDMRQILMFLAGRNVKFQNYFKSANAQGIPFRYVDSDQSNFGLCWAVTQNYLLVTTSGKAMQKLLETITK